MTLGDVLESARLKMGGMPRDEKELAKLKEQRNLLLDLRNDERKKKDSLSKAIIDKQAELRVTTVKQNQLSIAKEVLELKKNMDEIQKTENEISAKIDAVTMLINEKEREINDRKAREAGVSIEKIEIATTKREDRLSENKEMKKAVNELASVGGQEVEEDEDIDALIAAAMGDDAAPAASAGVKSDPSIDDIIAAASDPVSEEIPEKEENHDAAPSV